MFHLALKDSLHHGREGWAVIVQIALGISLFVVALSFVGTIAVNANTLLFGTIGDKWLVEPESNQDALVVDESTVQKFKEDSRASNVRLRIETAANASNPTATSDRPASASISLVGIDIANEQATAKNFGITSSELDNGQIVLHEQVAKQLGVASGDEITVAVGQNEQAMTVSAVATPNNPSFLLSSWALVDRAALGDVLYGDSERATTMLVSASDDAAPDIEAGLNEIDSSLVLTPWSDTRWSAVMLGPQIWGILLVVAFTFTFVVICIGLTSLVYSAMLTRVRDFAVLKTAGASAGSLRRMYLVQVGFQYLVGFAVGLLIGLAVIVAVNAMGINSDSTAFTFAVGSTTLELVPTWWALLGPFTIGLVLTFSILWFPIRAVCAQPVLDLLELR